LDLRIHGVGKPDSLNLLSTQFGRRHYDDRGTGMVAFAFFLLLNQGVPLPAPPSDSLYVSTVGTKFFLAGTARFRDFFLVRVENSSDAQKAIQFLVGSSASGNIRHQSTLSLLLRQLDGCDYSKDRCYFLFSPRTYDVIIDQPFSLEGKPELIFNVEVSAQKEQEAYSFARGWISPMADGETRVILRTQLGEILPRVYRGAP
jgi:hypothetical protein